MVTLHGPRSKQLLCILACLFLRPSPSRLDLNTKDVRALNPVTNSFCATGGFLANGTLVNLGGNDQGLQGVRLFDPCTDGSCDIFEDPENLHLKSKRWYPSSVRLSWYPLRRFSFLPGSSSGWRSHDPGR